jgi:predicted dehydrogenase
MTVALVIGQGSIGQRHARVLNVLGCDVAVVSRHGAGRHRCYADLDAALAREDPAYVVIANETAAHGDTLRALALCDFSGAVLVEKPLFKDPAPVPENGFRGLFVGYQLRFHPAVAWLADALAGQRAVNVTVAAGSYLPDWRPGRDYSQVYSADAAAGGGVLRDLSHELDLVTWMLGPWQSLCALGGRLGSLQISSDDSFALLAETERCPLVSVYLGYLDRAPRRRIVVNTDMHTLSADLIDGRVARDGEAELRHCDRDAPIADMHRAVLEDRRDRLCTAAQALAVLDMVAAVERSARDRAWVNAA